MLMRTSILAFTSAVSVLAQSALPGARVSAIAHSGYPIGKEIKHDGMTLYVTGEESDTAVLYLTDIYGIQLNENKLLADSFGRAGYLTVAPDMFNGTAPRDINDPGFNWAEFLFKHRPAVIDPMIASTIQYMRSELGVKKVVATGYCFGGRYAFRVLAEGKGVDAAFTAHPSFPEDSEIEAITGPMSVAAAEVDVLIPRNRLHKIEALLQETGQVYSTTLYSGTQHGFAVGADVSDPQQKFAKEGAFDQAVRWFDVWA